LVFVYKNYQLLVQLICYLLKLSWGAFHLKSPTGGCAYGISSQLATPLIKKPEETPEVVEIFKSFQQM